MKALPDVRKKERAISSLTVFMVGVNNIALIVVLLNLCFRLFVAIIARKHVFSKIFVRQSDSALTLCTDAGG